MATDDHRNSTLYSNRLPQSSPYSLQNEKTEQETNFLNTCKVVWGASLLDKELCLASKNRYLQGGLDLDWGHGHSNIPGSWRRPCRW
jgi:hypothetical protein